MLSVQTLSCASLLAPTLCMVSGVDGR